MIWDEGGEGGGDAVVMVRRRETGCVESMCYIGPLGYVSLHLLHSHHDYLKSLSWINHHFLPPCFHRLLSNCMAHAGDKKLPTPHISYKLYQDPSDGLAFVEGSMVNAAFVTIGSV